LRLPNGANQYDDLALEARAGEPRLETFRELGLADAGKARHVHRDASLQADRNQLKEMPEFHHVFASTADRQLDIKSLDTQI
jgi:hypothetical protein